MMINSVFHTPDSFCIYTSCVQHAIENNHYPSQRFCSGGEIISHLINNICFTFCEIIEFEDLRFRFIIVFGCNYALVLLLTKLQRSFYPLILFAQYMKKCINLLIFFKITSFAQHFIFLYQILLQENALYLFVQYL